MALALALALMKVFSIAHIVGKLVKLSWKRMNDEWAAAAAAKKLNKTQRINKHNMYLFYYMGVLEWRCL